MQYVFMFDVTVILCLDLKQLRDTIDDIGIVDCRLGSPGAPSEKTRHGKKNRTQSVLGFQFHLAVIGIESG